MVNLEQVEKLRQRADISYDEAKAALEETNGDILEAIINLEKQNRVESPSGGGYYNSKEEVHNRRNRHLEAKRKRVDKTSNGTSFGELVRKFVFWAKKMIGKGNRNHFEVTKDGEKVIGIPVTILAIFLCFAFWVVIPITIAGLFFGYRYEFNGPDLGKDSVNRAMNSVADAANNIKKDIKGEKTNEDSNN